MQQPTKIYGLLGKSLAHSFSPQYFNDKFRDLKLDAEYRLFEVDDISKLRDLVNDHPISGLNVTIPFKQTVMPYLDKISENAAEIGAVNTIKILKDGRLKGYNTDWFGFRQALEPMLKPRHQAALILGTGGSSKAVAFALEQMGVQYLHVSRSKSAQSISYDEIDWTLFNRFQIVINCTPIGMYPNITEAPPVPYQYFSKNHIAFDLIYNPETTLFLSRAANQGATISNGYQMLVNQAEKAYKIWNK